jgi:hypothetical protein
MMKYALVCERKHNFEVWFSDSGDYDKQRKRGLVTCPVCDSKKVEKAIMAPALGSSAKHGKDDRQTLATAPDPRRKAVLEALKEMRKQVTENADYVGTGFAEEARKIHYNEVEARAIYGEATSEEAKALVEEGVEFHPLPNLPDDRN